MKHSIYLSPLFLSFCLCIPYIETKAQSPYSSNTLKLDSAGTSPSAKIEQVSWLAGTWKGEGFGGILEESWLPPAGGSMVSVFRMLHKDKVVLFEINQLVEENGSLILKVKHFSPNLRAWEEKEKYVSFPLVKINDASAWFEGCTFHLSEKDKLIIYIVMESKDGKAEESKLTLSRISKF